jgi:hypothetical protein
MSSNEASIFGQGYIRLQREYEANLDSNLLRLPAELRIWIYKLVIADRSGVVKVVHDDLRQNDWEKLALYAKLRPRHNYGPPPLSLVCQRLRKEVLAVYYASTIMVFDLDHLQNDKDCTCGDRSNDKVIAKKLMHNKRRHTNFAKHIFISIGKSECPQKCPSKEPGWNGTECARVEARLGCPLIVLHDAETVEGLPPFVQRYVDGCRTIWDKRESTRGRKLLQVTFKLGTLNGN